MKHLIIDVTMYDNLKQYIKDHSDYEVELQILVSTGHFDDWKNIEVHAKASDIENLDMFMYQKVIESEFSKTALCYILEYIEVGGVMWDWEVRLDDF